MIRSMKDQGLSISEIARRLGISRTTVSGISHIRKGTAIPQGSRRLHD